MPEGRRKKDLMAGQVAIAIFALTCQELCFGSKWANCRHFRNCSNCATAIWGASVAFVEKRKMSGVQKKRR